MGSPADPNGDAMPTSVREHPTQAQAVEDVDTSVMGITFPALVDEPAGRPRQTAEVRFDELIGRSRPMLEVYERVARVAPHFRTVLITGATGTGKELVARALHRLSPVSPSQFVVCNCSALVDSLVESELFGYVRGAFTGAMEDKPGLFEYANGGTIFLDEIGELAAPAQAKLLRTLQHRQVQRVGSPIVRNLNVRVVAATNRDLRAMVRQGQFREDLYYRLAVVQIELPRLAERLEDLPVLERYFIRNFILEHKKLIYGITPRAQASIEHYEWPGNVRELKNVMDNACMMTESGVIDIRDLPDHLNPESPQHHELHHTVMSLADLEREHVIRVLKEVDGNKTRAAEILGIGRATIYHLLSRWKVRDAVAHRIYSPHGTA